MTKPIPWFSILPESGLRAMRLLQPAILTFGSLHTRQEFVSQEPIDRLRRT